MFSEEEKKWLEACQSLLDIGMFISSESSLWLINKVKELDEKLDKLQTEEEKCD